MDELYPEVTFLRTNRTSKVERADFYNIYYHFKDELMKRQRILNCPDILYRCEFFISIIRLYNDVLRLGIRLKILDHT